MAQYKFIDTPEQYKFLNTPAEEVPVLEQPPTPPPAEPDCMERQKAVLQNRQSCWWDG